MFRNPQGTVQLSTYKPWKEPFWQDLREMSMFDRPVARLCKSCGQFHSPTDCHLYDYHQAVDDDLTCQICLQPLVDPLDTKCGHTFCSRCIKNFLELQNMCPHDRNMLTAQDLQPASVIFRRLLDKLLVVCPNVDYCEDVVPRCELEAHLVYRCAGAVVKCVRHEQGCKFQGPRSAMDSHLWECEHRDDHDYSYTAPIEEGAVTRITLTRSSYDLGISIVGGFDTPLKSIIVQEVFPNGIVDMDDRIGPGDQLLEVNGVDLTMATHLQAKRALRQMLPSVRLTVYRDQSGKHRPIEKEDIIRLSLLKRPNQQLGIKLVGRRNIPGVYIMALIPGTAACQDGRLQVDDRILEVNDHNLADSAQEHAASMIQNAEGRLHLVISRRSRPHTPDILQYLSRSEQKVEQCRDDETLACMDMETSREKTILITKSRGESLGLSVAGGVASQRGDTPLYVMNILPNGSAYRCGIKKGDVLLSVNGNPLFGLCHNEAVRVLKTMSSSKKVELRLLDTGETTDGLDNFLPTWIYWLKLPRHCFLHRDVKLDRECKGGDFGFSVVGGAASSYNQPSIIVRAVKTGSVAAKHNIRCGDIILAINSQSVKDVSHTEAVSLLNEAGSNVTLRLLSWPGTIV